ncbi:MAG: hypothetical protein WBD20_28090 [Pirellulaceae bacterium]
MRFVVTITAVVFSTVAIAATKGTPVFAADPGAPPPFAPVLNPAVIVIALFFGSAAVLWGVSAYVRGKISRKKLIVTTSLLMLLTWGGLLVALMNAPANPQYEAWQQAHQRWKNKEIVGYDGDEEDKAVEQYDDVFVPK